MLALEVNNVRAIRVTRRRRITRAFELQARPNGQHATADCDRECAVINREWRPGSGNDDARECPAAKNLFPNAMHLFANGKGPIEATRKSVAHVEIRVPVIQAR